MSDVHDTLRHTKGKLYTVFADFTKAFHMLNSGVVIKKLEEAIGHSPAETDIIKNTGIRR
jgi:hypothetical protein